MKPIAVLKRYVAKSLKLDKEEHELETYKEITEACEFSGFNFWILGFAMIIACIGLNTDSVSAIIGAMLISPLMGPMVGYAFAISINDRKLKLSAIRNWIAMTLISLLASVLFFLLSPFDTNTEVLTSFTKATIFDILIAFFGGMAGFVGILKKDGVKVMAGVAVATACMPPLCTAGFGIAHLDFMTFIGGLYFYFINCLFIGLATFVTSRITCFHELFCKETIKNRMANWLWALFIVAMIVPSIFLVWQKWKEEKLKTFKVLSDKERIEVLEKKVRILDSTLHQNRQ